MHNTVDMIFTVRYISILLSKRETVKCDAIKTVDSYLKGFAVLLPI